VTITFTKPVVVIDVDNTLYDVTSGVGLTADQVRNYDDLRTLCGEHWEIRRARVMDEHVMVTDGLYDASRTAIAALRASGRFEVAIVSSRPADTLESTCFSVESRSTRS
jgi:hypothetical protein